MNKTVKIILFIVAGLIILCICGCVAGAFLMKNGGEAFMQYAVVDDPAQAAAAAEDMLDYQLPSGYQENIAINLLIMKAAIAVDADNMVSHPMIMIAEMPSYAQVDADTFRNQMLSGFNSAQSGRFSNMALSQQYSMTINNTEVPIFIYQGMDEEGISVKQLVSGMFPGKNGQIMLMIIGPTATWNQSTIDGFLNSIHN